MKLSGCFSSEVSFSETASRGENGRNVRAGRTSLHVAKRVIAGAWWVPDIALVYPSILRAGGRFSSTFALKQCCISSVCQSDVRLSWKFE